MIVNKEKVRHRFNHHGNYRRIMFPTTHDITPEILDDCIESLGNMLRYGHEVLIVSKPHLACIKEIIKRLLGYQRQILFRFTIGSSDTDILKFWEPNAPSFGERLDCLQYAFENGFKTSISMEPLLASPYDVIACTMPLITDSLWLGGLNKIKERVDMIGWGEKEKYYLDLVYSAMAPKNVKYYYSLYKDNPKIKYKDSFKKILGLEQPKQAGLDI
jgi:hypothetical protein